MGGGEADMLKSYAVLLLKTEDNFVGLNIPLTKKKYCEIFAKLFMLLGLLLEQ
jgi:hypothetical protein